MNNIINIGMTLSNRYQIIRKIAQGGMGILYEAYDIEMHSPVAIKVILTAKENTILLKRFENEIEAYTKLSHPNIVKIYNVGIYENTPYIVMEYINGIEINQYVAKMDEAYGQRKEKIKKKNVAIKERDWKLCANLIYETALTLEYIHQHQMFHRDIKPSNILIRTNGSPVIIDLGLVKFNRECSNDLTRTKDIVGTCQYMPIEQTQGKHGVIDARTDVYSLGLVLYELLTEQRAYSGKNMADMLQKIVTYFPPSPREINPQIPVQLDKITMRAIEKQMNKRYQTAQEFADDLASFISKNDTSKIITTTEKNISQNISQKYKTHKTIKNKTNLYNIAITIILIVVTIVILKESILNPQTKQLEYNKKLQTQQVNNQLQQKQEEQTQQENNRPWKKQDTSTQQENNRPWKKQDTSTQQENNRPWKNKKEDTTQEEKQAEQPNKQQQDTHYLENYAKSINLKDFEYLGIQHYTCENLSNDVAIYKHIPTNMRFVLVLGGDFTMGSNNDPYSVTPHKEHIDDFLMAQAPCTQEQWEIIMKERPWSDIKLRREIGYLVADYSKWNVINKILWDIKEYYPELIPLVENNKWNKIYTIKDRILKQKAHMVFKELMALCDPEVENEQIEKYAKSSIENEKFIPATFITPEDCEKFCKKTSFSMPTEAQWEYACRAGSQGKYCFGNNISLLKKYSWNGTRGLHKVMRKEPNAFGLYDMHGNICEYCANSYDHYRHHSIKFRNINLYSNTQFEADSDNIKEIPYYKDSESFQKDAKSGNYFQNASIRKYTRHVARGGFSGWGVERCTSAFRTWNWIPDYGYGVRFCVNLKK